MKASIIIATYNEPEWLQKVLWGYEAQSCRDFEIIVADDGSRNDTRQVIEQFKITSWMPIRHVWHEDKGYRKCRILNKAIQEAQYDYLIFTDGDCIPRYDFVEQHITHAEYGYFLSGGAVRLPMQTSKAIRQEHILSGEAFLLSWLRTQGYAPGFFKKLKLTAGRWSSVLNHVTPAKATWNGGNASGWKQDLIAINGFDERLEYGGQDRELGERLRNCGIRAKQLRYHAICVHLDHSRGYKTESSVNNIRLLRKYIRAYRTAWTSYGIQQETPSFR
jgi:glycosyltransferase involved in cell wall biosynthesis